MTEQSKQNEQKNTNKNTQKEKKNINKKHNKISCPFNTLVSNENDVGSN